MQILVLLFVGMMLAERLEPEERFYIIRRIQGVVFKVGLSPCLSPCGKR